MYVCICLFSSEHFVSSSRAHTLLSCCEYVMVVICPLEECQLGCCNKFYFIVYDIVMSCQL